MGRIYFWINILFSLFYRHIMHANKKRKTSNVTLNGLDIKSKYHQHSVLTLEFRINYYFV